jgi:hypothetical protein
MQATHKLAAQMQVSMLPAQANSMTYLTQPCLQQQKNPSTNLTLG